MSAGAVKTTYPAPAIQSAPGGKYPAGPGFLKPLLSGRVFHQTPLDALIENANTYGDLVHYRADLRLSGWHSIDPQLERSRAN